MSRLVDRIRHQFSDARPAKRAGLILLALAAFSVVGTSAWAYWTTQGAGTASATTGTLNPPTGVVASNTPVSTTVHVSWTAPTSGAVPIGYYVTPSGGTATSSTCGTVLSPAPATNCDYTGITTAGTFTYTVTAVFHSWTAISNTSNSVTVVPDTTPPTVASAVLAGSSPTNAGSVSWTVTFSETVTGVDSTDFSLTNTGLGGTPAVTSVSGSGSSYTVTASTGSGSGSLRLNVLNDGTIKDTVTNALSGATFNGATYTLDRTAPTITITSCNTGQPNRNNVIGTTNDNTGAVSVKFFVGSGIGGTLFATLSSPPASGAWATQTATQQLIGGTTYTAQATQTDAAGNVSNQPTCTFSAQ